MATKVITVHYLKIIRKNKLILSSTEKQSDVIVKYKTLIKEVKRDEAILSNLSSKLQQISLQEAEGTEPWELISTPTVLDKPIAPNRKLIVFMGLFSSLFFGYLVSFLKEKNSDLIFSPDEFKSKLEYPFIKTLKFSELNEWDDFFNHKWFLKDEIMENENKLFGNQNHKCNEEWPHQKLRALIDFIQLQL